jgi:hypothetical protein
VIGFWLPSLLHMSEPGKMPLVKTKFLGKLSIRITQSRLIGFQSNVSLTALLDATVGPYAALHSTSPH